MIYEPRLPLVALGLFFLALTGLRVLTSILHLVASVFLCWGIAKLVRQ